MPVAEKTHLTERLRTDERLVAVNADILSDLRAHYGRKVRVVDPGEDLVPIRGTAWYRKMARGRTPARALRVYRRNRELSQGDLAARLGPRVTKQRVADMEAGRRGISKETAKKLARILKAPVERFL